MLKQRMSILTCGDSRSNNNLAMIKTCNILIIVLAAIFICGCGNPYSKDFRLTTFDEGKGYTAIELSGTGGLQSVDGSDSGDYLVARKYKYNNLPIYYQLLYQYHSESDNLHPERLVFLIDKQKYVMTFLGSDKSNNKELAWITVETPFLEKIAKAKEVLLRIEGTSKSIDYVFNKKYLYFFKRFYKECVLSDKK
jgi:hypothetical protein